MPKIRKPPQNEAKSAAKTTTAPSDILDVDDVCSLLRIERRTCYRLFASGTLPGKKIGKRWLTTRAAVYRWLDSSTDQRDANTALLDQIENGASPETKKAALREMIKRGVPISAGQK
jgi:excisionase family DNA binding protein